MSIEVDYSEPGATCSVLRWISVGVALHVALRALVFLCEDEAVVELSFDFCTAAGCWLDNKGNVGSCGRATIDYEGGADTLLLWLNAPYCCQCGCGLMHI